MDEIADDRRDRMLGHGIHQPNEEYACFLPWTGEFGWYVMNWVKRFHGYNHGRKIACIKRGHECLFPSAHSFFYDWDDHEPDHVRAGVGGLDPGPVIERIQSEYGQSVWHTQQTDTGWDEKTSLSSIHFVPSPRVKYEFAVDVVIAPRLRQIDRFRNRSPEFWAEIVQRIADSGLTVGACGGKSSSHVVQRVSVQAWDHGDVDPDVHLLRNAKVAILQESGMAYLAYLCECPVIICDDYHALVGDLHRRPDVYFNAMNADPAAIANEVLRLIDQSEKSPTS